MATNIIGRGLAGLLKYIKLRIGPEGLEKVLEKLSAQEKALFKDRIHPTRWYSLKTYTNLLVIIDQEIGTGDLKVCKDIGRWAAERDFKAVYKLYTIGESFKDPVTFKTAPNIMWKGYYDRGELTIPDPPQSLDVNEFKFRITGVPDAQKPNCSLLEGWLEMAAKNILELNGTVTEVKCTTEGDEYCEFLWVREF